MGDGIVRGLRWVFKVEICCGWGELDSARANMGTILFLIVGLIGQWRNPVAFQSRVWVSLFVPHWSRLKGGQSTSQHVLTAEGHCPTD